MLQAISSPVNQRERIRIIDIIRGIAVLGILLMNIPYFAQPAIQAYNINVMNEYSGINYFIWWGVEGLFEGTMRALFSMLFGAGCLLLIGRLSEKPGVDAALIYYRRLIWLFLFGMFHAYILLWPGDILYAYAICGLFLYPFKDIKPKFLFIISMGLMLAMVAKGTYELYNYKQIRVQGESAMALDKYKIVLTEDQKADKERWLDYQEKVKPENMQKEAQKETARMQQDYFGIFNYLSGISAKLEGKKFYHWNFLDNMILIFLGMAFFKWGILTAARSKKFYWMLLISGYGLGLPLNFLDLSASVETRFDYTLLADKVLFELYEVRRILIACGHLSLVILLFKYGFFKKIFYWMSRVGQMAFSNYLMQTIICITVFYGFGFGLYGQLERYEDYYVVGCIWIFQVIFSNIWLHYFRFGPFEWVWRSLTYLKKQPFKKKKDPVWIEEQSAVGADVHVPDGRVER